MQNRNKAKPIGRLFEKAKRVLAVLAVFILTLSLGASALADGGKAGGVPGGAPSGGQQTPGGMGGSQQPRNGGGTPDGETQPGGATNGGQSREAEGVNLEKIEDAIATIEDETVQANLTALLEAYKDALEAKQAAIETNDTDSISDLAAAASAAKDALDLAMTEAGLSLDDILSTPEQAEDGTGRALGKPELDTESIAADIAALDDSDENKAALEALLSAYEAALEAQSTADTSSLTEDEIAALEEAVLTAETSLREAMASAGLNVNPGQPQNQAGKNGKPVLDTTSIAADIAALDDSNENKAALEALLSAYETALEAQSSADTSSLTEDEIAALDEAVTAAEVQLRESLQNAGLMAELTVQNQQEQSAEWQMTVISDNGTTTGTSANSGLLTAIFNWLSSLFK